MISTYAAPGLNLYAAPAAGSAEAVAMLEGPAGCYSAASADAGWVVYVRAGVVPDAADVACRVPDAMVMASAGGTLPLAAIGGAFNSIG